MPLFPVKCFTCGAVIEPRFQVYCDMVRDIKAERGIAASVIYFTSNRDTNVPTVEAEVLDKLEVHAVCCRRHFLTHPS